MPNLTEQQIESYLAATSDPYPVDGRDVSQVTNQDLIIDATHYAEPKARAELERRGIDWTPYMRCR